MIFYTVTSEYEKYIKYKPIQIFKNINEKFKSVYIKFDFFINTIFLITDWT